MATFASVIDLETKTGTTYTTAAELDKAEQSLEFATALIQSYTGRTIFAVANDVVTLHPKSTGIVLLPELPVTSVASVVDEDGTALTYLLHPAGVLRIASAWTGPVTVTYSHGYATVPTDIKMVCTLLAARAGDTATAGVIQEAEQIGSYNYSVRYAEGNEGGLALTSTELAVLNRYRVPVLA